MSKDAWDDLRLRERERCQLITSGLVCKIEQYTDHWTWEVKGRAYQNAAVPSMGDQPRYFEAGGKVDSKETAKRCVEIICNLFVEARLNDPTRERAR